MSAHIKRAFTILTTCRLLQGKILDFNSLLSKTTWDIYSEFLVSNQYKNQFSSSNFIFSLTSGLIKSWIAPLHNMLHKPMSECFYMPKKVNVIRDLKAGQKQLREDITENPKKEEKGW